MAGADGLINHTFEGLTQGVSQQATEARRETQLDAMDNCIPHLSRGILRRNPYKFRSALLDKDSNPLVAGNYFIYTYDRGTTGEQYLMLIGHREWYVYNANTGALISCHNDADNIGIDTTYLETNGLHPKDVFSFVTVGDFTWIANNQVTTAMSPGGDGLEVDYHKTVAIYWVKSTGNVVTASNPSTGAVTLAGYKYQVDVEYNDDAYTHTLDTATITGDNTYKTGDKIAEGIRDGLNTSHVGATTAARTEGPYYNVPNIYLTPVMAVKYNTITLVYDYYWDGILVASSSSTSIVVGVYTYEVGAYKTLFYGINFYEIKRTRQAVTDDDPLNGLWIAEGSMVYKRDLATSAILSFADSLGNTASYGFKGTVPSSDKLPETLPTGIGEVIVKIVGTGAEESGDEYWLKWDGDSWSETRAPNLLNRIQPTVMPHTIVRMDNGKFSFGYYGQFDGTTDTGTFNQPNSPKWAQRYKGDLQTAPEPGFIGKKISDMFIHNNRLGFLAEDSVVLSELSEYGNFWPTTVRTIPATDPIDLVVATTDVTGLKKAVSLSGLLLLFSDDAQFSLTGGSGALTPESAYISAVSSYNYTNKAPARVIGNKVYFTTESGNGTQQFAFSTSDISGGASNITADNTSLHIPTYLPKNIHYMQGHSVFGYIFMLSPDEPNTIYVLNTLDINNQNAQTAYHRWVFNRNVLGISVLNNTLNIILNDNGNMKFGYIDLDLPSDHTAVSYMDDYDGVTPEEYTSVLRTSKWHVKDAKGFGTRRGRLQIRTTQFTVEPDDSYKVSIINDSILQSQDSNENWVLSDAVWDDNGYWSYSATNTDDSIVYWKDGIPFFARVYYNDDKITVASNADTTFMEFSNNELDPSKGFALSTINMEGMWRQRSQRF